MVEAGSHLKLNNSIITDLTQSNHGIIVVTDVVVATWYVVFVVAQLKEDIQHQGPARQWQV